MTAQSGTIGAAVRGDSATPPTVVFIIPNGPADAAGMRLGDQVTAVDGQAVAGIADATTRLKGAPGTPVQIAVSRSGAVLAFTVTRAP
jgi:regulator of sigma E protease